MSIPNGKEKVIKFLLDRGCYLFGLVSGRKIPKKESKNWQNVAFNNYDAIKKSPVWSIYDNIGISCGLSNLVVIDCDIKDKVDKKTGEKIHIDGQTAFIKLCNKLNIAPTTFTVQTASGGYHYYFSNPKNYPIESDQNKLATGIDIRAAGGYVVAPEQHLIHCEDHDAGRYTIKIQSEFNPLPEALAQHILKEQKKTIKEKQPTRKNTGGFPDTPKNRSIIKGSFDYLDPDCDRNDWRDIIWALRWLHTNAGWDDDDWIIEALMEWSVNAIEYVWSDAEAEFWRIWDYHDESRTSDDITIASFFYKVQKGKEDPYWATENYYKKIKKAVVK